MKSVILEDYPKIYDNPMYPHDSINIIMERDKWIKKTGMYAYVCHKWVKPLARWIGSRRCLEIMAGAGYLTAALRECSVDIIATDNGSWQALAQWSNVIHPIQMDAEPAIATFADEIDIVIVSWPPMNGDLHEAISKHWVNKPIIFIGELHGCTADWDFSNNFNTIPDDHFELVSTQYKPWFGIRDELLLGKYEK